MNRMSVEERRSQLVDAAMTIAVREGVEAVTVRGVAAEAGVSLGVVHYCFEDKDELLQAMGHSLAFVASEPVRAAISVSDARDVASLANAAAMGLWKGLTPRRHMRLLTFEFATAGVRSRALRSVAQAHLAQTWTMTRGFLESVADVAGVEYTMDIQLLSRLVAGYIDGIELAWLVEQDDETAIASFQALANYVLSLTVPRDGSTAADTSDDRQGVNDAPAVAPDGELAVPVPGVSAD